MKALVFDSENNGLLHHFNRQFEYHHVSKMWVIAGIDLQSGDRHSFGPQQLDEGLAFLSSYDLLIGHNIIEYDFEVFKQLRGWTYTGKVIDTLVLSRYLYPERAGGHTIEAWGKRVGHYKPEHDDWSQFSPEMLARCEGDAFINMLVYRVLLEELKQRKQTIEGVQLWA